MLLINERGLVWGRLWSYYNQLLASGQSSASLSRETKLASVFDDVACDAFHVISFVTVGSNHGIAVKAYRHI